MLLTGGKVVFTDRIEQVDVLIENGSIVGIGKQSGYDGEIINLDGKYLTAGFVDIHTHGGYGADFMDCTDDAFTKALTFHSDNGTTTVVPTSCTAPREQLIGYLDFAKKYMQNSSKDCAHAVGVHLEGPFLSVKNRGAQRLEDLKVPKDDDYSYMLDYADIIKTVTISPELDGADQMTKALTEKGIMVSGGHDDGIYPEFMPSVENGMRHLTHLYCAMSDLRFKDGVRNVGLREYALIDDNLTVEMIADNKHITPELAKMIIRAKGVDKVCVVSDCLRCAGMPNDGKLYLLGSGDSAQYVKVSDGVATLADGSKFAGSITCVRQMVKNLIQAGIPICDAVRMGTYNPAKIINEDERIGSIELGKQADLCILDDNFEVDKVILKGKIIKNVK